MPRDERLDRLTFLASRQHGAFSRSQAQAVGFSRSAIDHRIRSGSWEAADYGVYRIAGTPSSWRQRLVAACLSGPAVASHRAAASLWTLPGFDDAKAEVSAVRYRRRHPSDIVWHESLRLEPDDITELDGIAVTTPTRTIVDLGSVCDLSSVLHAYDDAVRRRLTDWFAVARRVEQFGQLRRGSGVVRLVLERRDPTAPVPESHLETTFDQFAHDHGLPVPVRQHWVELLSGDRARLDFAFPEVLLGVEIDSVRHHAGPDEWRRDIVRQNELAALGWRTLRFSSEDLKRRPDEVERLIRAALTALNLPGDIQIRNKNEP